MPYGARAGGSTVTPMRCEQLVNGIELVAANVQGGVGVATPALDLARWRAFVGVVGGVEHQLGVAETEQRPVEVTPLGSFDLGRRTRNGEAEYVAIEAD
jgi:hypothetical protein